MERLMKVDIFYFSPTGTTKKYIEGVTEGINSDTQLIDITSPGSREKPVDITGDIVIWAFPVYGGRIPKVALDYFRKLQGNKTPLVIIVVYGNVSEGVALNQAVGIGTKNGFRFFSGGAFVAEHSYASHEVNVALGRPNTNDLVFAKNYGEYLRTKWEKRDFEIPELNTSLFLQIIKNIPYSTSKRPVKRANVNMEKCVKCYICSAVCPVYAISEKNLEIDTNKCIQCYACSKNCPNDARDRGFSYSYLGKIFSKLGRKLKENKIYY